MELLEDAGPILRSVNKRLSEADDPARIRYYEVVADPYLDDKWIVAVRWVLPDREDGADTWPSDTIRRYSRLLSDVFRRFSDAWPLSRFSTADELAELGRLAGQRDVDNG